MNREVTDALQRCKIIELLENGLTVVERGVDIELCEKASNDFLNWKNRNKDALLRFCESDGRLMGVISLHQTLPAFEALFSLNRSLAIQDYLFERETALYTSLFYERGTGGASVRRSIDSARHESCGQGVGLEAIAATADILEEIVQHAERYPEWLDLSDSP